MKTKRWMKWIVEANTDTVDLPWARGKRRSTWKSNAKDRARAA